MKKFIEENKKLVDLIILIVLSICAILAFYLIAKNPSDFFTWLSNVWTYLKKLCSPIISGLFIAYMLYRPCRALCRFIMKTKAFSQKPRLANAISIFVVFTVAVALLVAFMFLVIPNSVESITALVARLTELKEPMEIMLDRLCRNELFVDIMQVLNIDVSTSSGSSFVVDLISAGQGYLTKFGASIYGFVVNIGSFLYNFFIGFIIAVYINLDNEHLLYQFKRLCMYVFGKHFDRVSYIARLSDKTFVHYFGAKIATSVFIGILGYFCCLVFRIQYAATIGVIIAVTNLIPIFGPWIGGVFCVLFTMLSGLKKALIVGIIIVGVQQVDSSIIQPKILGKKIDLAGFWVFVSVIIMGSIGGVGGMLIAMPLFSVLQTLVGEALRRKLDGNDELDVG